MEAAAAAEETEDIIVAPVEFEDIDLSDEEDIANTDSVVQLTIDGNSRIISKGSVPIENGRRYCEKESNYSAFQSSDKDLYGDTSSEEVDFSDDGAACSKKFKEINLDGMAFAGINQHFDASSSFNHSSTVFKSMNDADEDISLFERRSLASRDGHSKTLASGLSVSSVFASVREFFSGKPDPSSTLSISNPFTNAVFVKSDKSGNEDTPLMTCVEFLKTEISDDEGTDVEEMAMEADVNGSYPQICKPLERFKSSGGGSILDDNLRCRGKGDFMSLLQSDNRRSSWTTEMISDDESTENMPDMVKSKTKKRNSYSNVYEDNDCLTDEEVVDMDEKEWTETDESGGVRQITQIKTETSINFEGDGDGSAIDGDGLVSTTTSTTTRVVTSVISDPEGESEFQSTFVQQLSDDDIRQSCEITVSEVLNADTTPKESENDE